MRLIPAILITGSILIAQEPLIKTTTRLVQISVVAKSHEQPVGGLTADDFKLFADGRPQKIAFFSAVSASDHPAAAIPIAPNTYTNVMAAKGQAMNGVTVVLLDLVNTKLNDRIFAQRQLIKYLLSIPSEDRVAVYSFNGRLRVLHDYTSSMQFFQERLSEAGGKLVSVADSEDNGAIEGGSDSAALANMMRGGGGGEEARAFFLRNRVIGTLNVLKFIAAHLAEVPGRKNLVWLSSGFPLQFGFEKMSNAAVDFFDEMDATVRTLSDANVAVYPVDARGLTTLPGFSASQAGTAAAMGPGGKNPRPSKSPTNQNEVQSHLTMEELAHRTGGHAYYNTNDLAKAIHEAVAESTLTYNLGFYPEEEKHNRDFHKLKVEVAQPHINLNYRSGYLDLAAVPKDDHTRSIQMHDVVWSPLDATELGINVKLSPPMPSAAVLPGQAAPPPGNQLDVAVTLNSKGIQVEPKDNRYTGRIDFVMVQFDREGRPIDLNTNTPIQSVQLNMLEATYRKFLNEGLNVKQTLNLSPGTNALRVIVRDYGSGMIGSVTIPVKGTS